MVSKKERLGDYIQQCNTKNKNGELTQLFGINIQKCFMPTVANTTGLDLRKYKIVRKWQFAYNPMHVGRDRALPIALLRDKDQLLVSPAYVVFDVKDTSRLVPDYLMMWFDRKEFDRRAWFTTDNSVRGGFSWNSLCKMEIPYVEPDRQREIVDEYNHIMNRTRLNEEMNTELHKLAGFLRSISFGG